MKPTIKYWQRVTTKLMKNGELKQFISQKGYSTIPNFKKTDEEKYKLKAEKAKYKAYIKTRPF